MVGAPDTARKAYTGCTARVHVRVELACAGPPGRTHTVRPGAPAPDRGLLGAGLVDHGLIAEALARVDLDLVAQPGGAAGQRFTDLGLHAHHEALLLEH